MKKILMSLGVVTVVLSVATIGSYALWSDVETSSGNTFTADKLDAVLNDYTISIGNLKPGDSGTTGEWQITNDSNTVSSKLVGIQIKNFNDNENVCVEPELNEGGDITCDNPGAGMGELSQYLRVGIRADLNGDGVTDIWDTRKLSEFIVPGTDHSYVLNYSPSAGPLSPGATARVWMNYWVEDNSVYTDNIFMTDSCVFDMEFTLTQDI